MAACIPLLSGNSIVRCTGTAALIREPAGPRVFLTPLLFRLSPTINATGAETTPRRELISIRECQIMHWVAEGKRNAEIAAILGVSPPTVRAHLEPIFDQLDVSARGRGALLAAGRRSVALRVGQVTGSGSPRFRAARRLQFAAGQGEIELFDGAGEQQAALRW